jgi:Tol biopolymer transport system component
MMPNCKSCFEPSLSPSGQKIAFGQQSSEGSNIWQMGIDSDAPKPLIQNEANSRDPEWSPDGSMIAYRVQEDPYTLDTPDGPRQMYRHSSLHVVKLDGTENRQLTRRDGVVLTYDWAPDSEQLVVSACLEDLNEDSIVDERDRARLYIIDLDTYEVQLFLNDVDTKLSVYRPSWSPDGTYISYIEGRGDPASYGDLIVVRVDDGFEIVRLGVSPSAEYAWSNDGTKIAYVELWTDDRVSYEDLFVFELSTGDVTRLTDTSQYTPFGAWELNGITLSDPIWSVDGDHLAFIWRTGGKDYIVVASTNGLQVSRIVELGSEYHRLVVWRP